MPHAVNFAHLCLVQASGMRISFSVSQKINSEMTRGNQRDLAREKAAKKQKEQQKKKGASAQEGNKGMSLEARKQRDADIMREKQEKKAAAKAAKEDGKK